nr:cyclin A/B/D/E [Tanacetum cinerariifolium]
MPETLYLTAYLIDLFLSQHCIERKKPQLLGITCMLIDSKYEDICAPAIEELCFITDSTNSKPEERKSSQKMRMDILSETGCIKVTEDEDGHIIRDWLYQGTCQYVLWELSCFLAHAATLCYSDLVNDIIENSDVFSDLVSDVT